MKSEAFRRRRDYSPGARARLSEIFSGIQGEGLYVGERQIFLRFAGCNLRCRFCDTRRGDAERPRACLVEDSPGSRRFGRLPNPLEASSILAAVARLEPAGGPRHPVSLTGGEPLLWVEMLEELLPALRAGGHKTYLETNGTLPGDLMRVRDHVDVVAMDVKLPSATGQRPRYGANREFLAASLGADVFVKVVVAGRTTPGEVLAAARLVASVDASVPLVIQPATGRSLPGERLIGSFLDAAASALQIVRVIPQTHKIIGQR